MCNSLCLAFFHSVLLEFSISFFGLIFFFLEARIFSETNGSADRYFSTPDRWSNINLFVALLQVIEEEAEVVVVVMTEAIVVAKEMITGEDKVVEEVWT